MHGRYRNPAAFPAFFCWGARVRTTPQGYAYVRMPNQAPEIFLFNFESTTRCR